MTEGNNTAAFDPFTKMWTDMMGRMAASGASGPAASSDLNEHMRKAFFASMAEHAEQFMRSEQFLSAMKQGLDNSLALKQQIDQLLTRTLQSAQMPSRSDTDHIVLLVRGAEERITDKLEELTARVEDLEHRLDKSGGGARKQTARSKKR